MASFSETTLQSEFYSPWPKFGKRFSLQLNESRANAEALHPVVRAAGLDSAYTTIKNAAVAALEIGEQDFHNKYRIFWDKTRTTFRIQQNTGTTTVPIWTDRFTIGSSGELIGNFYPTGSSITVKTTSGLPPVFNNVDTLLFNRESFYLSTSSAGKPVVNFSGTASGGGGGVTAHSALTGLTAPADDHTQYLLASEAGSRATFDTNWTDLTDSGTTTLHTHSHVNLTNLSADDHTQYLLVNGTRAMTGDLNMGGKDVLNAYSGVFNDKISAEAFYLRKGGEVKAYKFNPADFYLTRASDSSFQVNLITQNITITSDNLDGSIPSPKEYVTRTVKFNRRDFYITADTAGHPIINAAAIGGSGLVANTVTFKDGSLPNYVNSVINFNPANFYLTGTSSGQPMLNALAVTATPGLSSITVKEATIPNFSTDTITFNSSNFYLTKDSIGKPMVNLVSSGGGTGISSITVKEATIPSFSTDTITFNSSDFYLTKDTAGKPMVNSVNYFNGALVRLGTNQNYNNTTPGNVNFDTLIYDTNGWFTATGQFTVPSGVSLIRVYASLAWAASASGYRRLSTQINSVTRTGAGTSFMMATPAGSAQQCVVSAPLFVVPGDLITVLAEQSSGGSINLSASGSTYLAVAVFR